MTDKEKSKPVHKIRAGALELAIWRNDGEVPACRLETFHEISKRLASPRLRPVELAGVIVWNTSPTYDRAGRRPP